MVKSRQIRGNSYQIAASPPEYYLVLTFNRRLEWEKKSVEIDEELINSRPGECQQVGGNGGVL